VLAIAAALLCARPGLAAETCLPRLRAELNVGPHGVPLATLTINGGAAHLMLDTGAERTTLTETAARRLGLLADFDHAQTMRGVGGNIAAGVVRPDLTTPGGHRLPGVVFAVVPVQFPPVDEEEVDGLLGADMLGAYDIDLDIGHHLILLYDPPDCPNPTLPWRRGYAIVEGQFSRHRHIAFPITLDGQHLRAFIDTGAQVSLLDAAATRRLGVTAASLGADAPVEMQGVSTQVVTAREHRFGRLEMAEAVLLAPTVAVMPLRLDDADMLMGTDMLMRQRIWLSYAGRRIFVARPE
jgi:predicted aspartyl protease